MPAPDPYGDLDAYLALPRVSDLALSHDGTRLVTTVATLDAKSTRYVSALWEVDPAGARPARRLTHSAKGEGGGVFTPAGEVLFTSARPDPSGDGDDDDTPTALWLLPVTGEGRVVGTRPGGIGSVVVACEAGTVAVLSDTLPASTDTVSDEERRKARKDKKVDAVLHAGYPVRYWDTDLGVGQTRLLVTDPSGESGVEWRDLTPAPGRALLGGQVDLTPDGRTAVDAAAAPVRLDARTEDQQPTALPGPPTAPQPPGSLTEVTTTAVDGTALRAWLAMPDGDGPHPLLLWVHGGPLSSWNGWSWRWNPWLMAARGYAVLLPDPALSTGYGREMVSRGWGAWGDAPYTDLLALTDAALEHPAVDAGRTAAMGGSFGGYMANWIAGHTDRFRAVVTHASLWDLEQFGPTTDAAYYWTREMTAQMSREHSPSRYADAIRSPMLVIHGDKDYRVPIGEGLRLWWDLCARAEDPETMAHRFLYFPNENHWVLTPQHAKIWYETVLAFLAAHVLEEPWETPELLR